MREPLLGLISPLLLIGPGLACPASSATTPVAPPAAGQTRPPAMATPAADGSDYRHRLRPTPYGWPHRSHWCVWVEPVQGEGPGARWDQAWWQAVQTALDTWQGSLSITRVNDPDRAQIRLLRRRPPLRGKRASHGRAVLDLALVTRGDTTELEPLVTVFISPEQRPEAMEATALHELGHAFGLWGHSDRADDAMGAVPGARPIRQLSPRDRATMLWLQQQPGLHAAPAPPETPATDRSPHRGPTAD